MTMRRVRLVAVLALGAAVFVAAGIDAAQRGWVLPLKAAATPGPMPVMRGGFLVARPQAEISGIANGVYCAHPAENGVGIHDLGALPAGMHVVVTVESFSEDFDPVATVLVPTIGEKAANTAKIVTFYDNDSGGDKDARVDFVTPQSGNYLLLVGDFTDAVMGCYRYQVVIQE